VTIIPGKPLDLADASVDGVTSFQVLEHVWDIDWYLRESYRILKPGGWLLLSTHGTWLFHPHPTDFRRWTRPGLEDEIKARGFTHVGTLPIAGPLAWTLMIRDADDSADCLSRSVEQAPARRPAPFPAAGHPDESSRQARGCLHSIEHPVDERERLFNPFPQAGIG
jgi:SAM-dependent methyltransferase